MFDLGHRRFRRAVDGFADGELDDPAIASMLGHLHECAGCGDDLAMIFAIKESLRRMAGARPASLRLPPVPPTTGR